MTTMFHLPTPILGFLEGFTVAGASTSALLGLLSAVLKVAF